jgi:hypothetical protein
MVTGPDLMALSWYPADRLALGPVTFGGMVVRRGGHSVRVTCLDTSGRFDVWVGSSAGFRRALPEASDSDAAGVMWHLMDAGATRPVLGELVGRLLLWAWLDDSHDRRRRGPGRVDAVVPGVRAFARGDMDALAGLLGGEEDRAETALSRPECLPDEMPLPTGATFVFALPTASGDMAAHVYVRRPVAEVIADLEGRLAEEGWTVVAEQSAVVWPDDLRFRVVRRGQTWTVHMEPSVGSATETNVIYAPV